MRNLPLLLGLMLIACTVQQEPLVLGFIPAERADEITPDAQALADFLSQELGREVEIVIPSSYEPLLEGLRFGHIDFSYMDGGPAWLAHQQGGAEVLLAEVENNSTFYYATLFVRQESDIDSLEDLRGSRIAFTSLTGSSGFIMPIGTLVTEGLITPQDNSFPALQEAIDAFFSENTVSGGYTQSLNMLIDSRVDVVGGAHDAPERFLSEDEKQQIKELSRLGRVPSHVVVAGEHVPGTLRTDFVLAMMKLNTQENQQIIQDLYGVDELTITNTQEHLGDFGPVFENLPGIRDMVLS